MSKRTLPRIMNVESLTESTAKRWQIRAPRSWPMRMMGCLLMWAKRERREVRMVDPTLRLSCGPWSGWERP